MVRVAYQNHVDSRHGDLHTNLAKRPDASSAQLRIYIHNVLSTHNDGTQHQADFSYINHASPEFISDVIGIAAVSKHW
jgi:hypothetical protein